jgi:WD40 repeat protein
MNLAADPAKTAVATDWTHGSPLIACRFDPTGRFVFAGAEDFSVQRWEVESGANVGLKSHDSWVRALGFSPDGQTLYTGGYDGRLMWWPAAVDAPAPVRTIDAHRGWLRALAISPDGATIATAGNDHLVRLWNAADGALIRELAGHQSHVYNVAFHPGGADLASCDLKGGIIHWELATGAEKRRLDASPLWKFDGSFMADIGGARAFTFNADGTRLAAGGITNVSNAFAGVGNPLAIEFDWTAGTVAISHTPSGGRQGSVWGLAYHADGFLIGGVGGTGGGYVNFWKFDSVEPFQHTDLPAIVRELALHPDGLRLGVAHGDGHLRIYRMTDPPPA